MINAKHIYHSYSTLYHEILIIKTVGARTDTNYDSETTFSYEK